VSLRPRKLRLSEEAAAAKIDADKPEGNKVDIDLDEAAPQAQGAVVAGQMTPEAAKAKKLFDSGAMDRRGAGLAASGRGDTGDDAGNKQLSEYYLAIALYRLNSTRPATPFSVSSPTTRTTSSSGKRCSGWPSWPPSCPSRRTSFERLASYTDTQIARFDNAQQRDLYWQLNYMLGRYKYGTDSIRRRCGSSTWSTARASTTSSPSSLLASATYAAQIGARGQVLRAGRSGPGRRRERAWRTRPAVRDLAYLSMARTFYSASVRLDPETNSPQVDPQKLSAAVKYWNMIDVASEYWLDSLFEESWAYFMAGDYPRALATSTPSSHRISPGRSTRRRRSSSRSSTSPTATTMAATIVVAKFNKKYTPIREGLSRCSSLPWTEPGGALLQFLKQVREGEANLDETIRPLVENALSDRQLLRNSSTYASRRRAGSLQEIAGPLAASGLGGKCRTRSSWRVSWPCAAPASWRCSATSATWTSSTSTCETARRF